MLAHFHHLVCWRAVVELQLMSFFGVDCGDTLCKNELMAFWCSLGELHTGDVTSGCFCLGGVQTGVFWCSLCELHTGGVN